MRLRFRVDASKPSRVCESLDGPRGDGIRETERTDSLGPNRCECIRSESGAARPGRVVGRAADAMPLCCPPMVNQHGRDGPSKDAEEVTRTVRPYVD